MLILRWVLWMTRISEPARPPFAPLTEVWILQGIYPLKDEWVFGCSLKTRLADQTKNSTTEVVMVKRLNELNNQPEIG